MLTKDILFGMNLLSLAGFLVMGLSLTLHRTGNAGIPLSIGLMCAGTALVFYGLFSAARQTSSETCALLRQPQCPDAAVTNIGGSDEISIWTADTAT